ncbi:MAG: glutaminyl-peptide cyclotransferase [Candidatus Bathyarchaeia archaeon]|jgi:glutamine cyclotransferase
MKQLHAVLLLVVVVLAACSVTLVLLNNNPDDSPNSLDWNGETGAESELLHYTYNVVNVYPHDETAFTQGLVYANGTLYEGTGLHGQSTLRKVDLETGNVTQLYSLSSDLFGEGITVLGDKLIQLTWLNHVGFVYDVDSFELRQQFSYNTQGWGITNNGTTLIMSDGTATLYFLEPQTFQIVGHVEVFDEEPVTNLNELEYVNGLVYANIWEQDKIAIINPQTGQVQGWVDLTGIYSSQNLEADQLLNGIAYDPVTCRLFVTGKMWSKLFEIQLVLVE